MFCFLCLEILYLIILMLRQFSFYSQFTSVPASVVRFVLVLCFVQLPVFPVSSHFILSQLPQCLFLVSLPLSPVPSLQSVQLFPISHYLCSIHSVSSLHRITSSLLAYVPQSSVLLVLSFRCHNSLFFNFIKTFYFLFKLILLVCIFGSKSSADLDRKSELKYFYEI